MVEKKVVFSDRKPAQKDKRLYQNWSPRSGTKFGKKSKKSKRFLFLHFMFLDFFFLLFYLSFFVASIRPFPKKNLVLSLFCHFLKKNIIFAIFSFPSTGFFAWEFSRFIKKTWKNIVFCRRHHDVTISVFFCDFIVSFY